MLARRHGGLGGTAPAGPGAQAGLLAHTSPVHVEVDGVRVARALVDARWCLAFLDRLEAHVTAHGRFVAGERDRQLGDLVAVIDEARTFYRGVAAAASS